MQYIKTLKIQTQLTNINLFKICIYILHCIYLYTFEFKCLVEPEWESEKKKDNHNLYGVTGRNTMPFIITIIII